MSWPVACMVNDFVVPVQGPGRQVHVPVRNGIRHLVDADSAGGKGVGVELGAHRIFLGAEYLNLGHAADHRDALCHHGSAYSSTDERGSVGELSAT